MHSLDARDRSLFHIGLPETFATGAILLALLIAVRAVADIDWPGEIDFYRDMSAAQALLDGDWLGDPAYQGETRWYNPLVPSLFATLAGLSHRPVHTVVATCGPILNLGGPLFFFVASSLLVGRWGGLFALIGYLFLGDVTQPSWMGATYSPWPWPMNVSQGLFYLTLALYFWSLRGTSAARSIVTGLALGMTALGHTAPAAIAALLVLLHGALACARAHYTGTPILPHAARVGLIGVVSFVVSLPFLYPIYRAYSFHIVNKVPGELTILWGRTALAGFLSTRGVLASGGLAMLLVTICQSGFEKAFKEILLLELLGVVTGLFVYSLTIQRLNSHYGLSLPQLVPSFHFHLYLKAVESMLFGFTAATAARFLGGTRFGAALVPIAAAFSIFACLPSYLSRVDLSRFHDEALRLGADRERIALHEWIAARTAPKDVFLAGEKLSIYAISAAGRKVVALDGGFSNPYVSFEERRRDREEMLLAIATGEHRTLWPLVEKYRVRYIVLESERPDADLGLVEVFRSGRLATYRVPQYTEP